LKTGRGWKRLERGPDGENPDPSHYPDSVHPRDRSVNAKINCNHKSHAALTSINAAKPPTEADFTLYSGA